MADRFVKGTLILTAAGLMVKILASVNRIFLSRLLGGEGIGLYQLAYPLYNLLVGIVAAGIPAAMSLIVARYAAQKEWGSVRRVGVFSFPGLFGSCRKPCRLWPDPLPIFSGSHQG